MKILIVNSLYPPNVIGGAEISCQKLAIELKKKGHQVFVLTTSDSDNLEYLDGVCVIKRRFSNIMSFWDFKHSTPIFRIIYKLLDIYSFKNMKIINDVLSEIKPDVIHANTIYGITPVLWRCGKKNKIPIVQTLRDYYFICPKANLISKTGNCNKPRLLCKLFSKLHIFWSRNITAATAPSNYTLNRFEEAGFFENALKKTIYNATDYDLDRFDRIAKQKMKNIHKKDNIHIAFVGSFIETKGIKVLLTAIKKAPDYMIFHFLGKGKLESEIIKNKNQGNNIIIEGFLNEKKLNDTLENMDMLVCPSIWEEPFGRVVIDAYNSCLPVIATSCGGLPELIENGVTGKIIPPNDPDAIIRAVKDLSKICATESSIKAIRDKLTDFSIERQGEEFIKVFRKSIELNKKG